MPAGLRIVSTSPSGKVTSERALGIAVDIERSYVERKVLNHFNGDTPAVAQALTVLREESFRHAADTELAWLAARRGAPVPSP